MIYTSYFLDCSKQALNYIDAWKKPVFDRWIDRPNTAQNLLQSLQNRRIFSLVPPDLQEFSETLWDDFSNLLLQEIESGKEQDAPKLIRLLCSFLSSQQAKIVIKEQQVNFDARQQEADLYLKMTQVSVRVYLVRFFYQIEEALISCFESFLHAFGVGSFFESPQNPLEAEQKSYKIMALMSMMQSFAHFFEAKQLRQILPKAIGSMIGISIAWPMVQPTPLTLPFAENWSQQIRKEGHECKSPPRKETLDHMAKILQTGRQVIVTGPSGVGKTHTVEALAQAIEQGLYPALKGKTVFYINTTNLTGQAPAWTGGPNQSLKNIAHAMGRHADDIILVLDEIHIACKDGEPLCEQMKTCLDRDFPHVIGLTTKQEYKDLILPNEAFARRFEEVEVRSASKDDTYQALSLAILQHPAKPIVENAALEAIYDQSSVMYSKLLQPAASLKLLDNCIHQIQSTTATLEEKKLSELNAQVYAIYARAAATGGQYQEKESVVVDLKSQIQAQEKIVSKQKEERQKLQNLKNALDAFKTVKYRSIMQKDEVGYFCADALLNRLKQKLQEGSTTNKVPVVIDKSIVDAIIQ